MVPVEIAVQLEAPTEAIGTDLPVVGEIRLWRRVAGDEARESGMDRVCQMLLRTPAQLQRMNLLQRTVIGDTQGRQLG